MVHAYDDLVQRFVFLLRKRFLIRLHGMVHITDQIVIERVAGQSGSIAQHNAFFDRQGMNVGNDLVYIVRIKRTLKDGFSVFAVQLSVKTQDPVKAHILKDRDRR